MHVSQVRLSSDTSEHMLPTKYGFFASKDPLEGQVYIDTLYMVCLPQH